MITKVDGKYRLEIFERFQIDYNLPKHSSKKNEIQGGWITVPSTATTASLGVTTNTITNAFGQSVIWNDPTMPNRVFVNIPGEGVPIVTQIPTFWQKVKNKLKKKKADNTEAEPVTNLVPIFSFFNSIPLNDLENARDIVEYYEKAIIHSKETGQKALEEKLLSILKLVKAETILIDNQLTKYVTEDQLIELYQASNPAQKLKLTWIKNFIKIIPTDVLDVKKKVDTLGIFDNYVILHYDPKNDATDLTKEEVRLKKDPILFGVSAESNKLYYLADWVDEYCDMTLEKMFKTLGEKVLEINNQTVKRIVDGNFKPNREKIELQLDVEEGN